jgi:uroporphyrinogen-III decarboxylase
MDREYYLDLAKSGVRMPVGAHLVLHEQSDAEAIMNDGARLGGVVAETAQRFRTPLAFPLMDLTLEKDCLLAGLGIPPDERATFHFEEPPRSSRPFDLSPRMTATCDGIRFVAQKTRLLPVGMCIGPFSLTTKLLADPITPVYLAGTPEGESEPQVALLHAVLEASTEVIRCYLRSQIKAGAKAMIICEPAANKVYFSPRQLAGSYAVFDRMVMEPNRQIRSLLGECGVDLIFHDCGELLEEMVRRFASLDPAILSLGSSRVLWEDAALVSPKTVLYGNLPTKKFYSDALVTREEVKRLSLELIRRMNERGHPFILGSECDVLSVPGQERTIWGKVEEFLNCN